MTTYYFRNVAGMHLSDEQMERIPHPRLELLTHVTTKTVQSGALLGTAFIGPVVSCVRGNRDWSSIQESAYAAGKRGALLGLVMGPVFVMMRLRTMDRQGAYDRALRIRYNCNQNFVDRLSTVGTIAGIGAAHYLGAELQKGALFGMLGGCVLAGVINNVF